ncbi:branched-chain amino acid aminotransferase -like [Panicum miliaceum]|uniref:Branched-chain amino acid aminotransferase-like n=1 Tax=Panicum miliaceum TaxID=4540 RepID=A0A3L6SHQ9_PANMI|nr:branched-chain amino acid aminotransferase -like [Panicum miliaceum]
MGSYVQGDEVPVYESGAEVLQMLQQKCRSSSSSMPAAAAAMYSSVLGGIILDPAMMLLPVDDHMVHRGHGVFDTAMLLDGCLYELDPHLDRFLRSAARARIASPFPRDTLRSILIRMTAASGCRRGSIRYWLSAGPGDFLLSPKGCPSPAFYAVVIPAEYEQCREGVRAVTTSVPMKPPLFATTKNAKRSVEMAFVGSGLPVLPIVEWDGQPIGDGKVGDLMLALSDLLWEDMKSGPDRIAVPYTN